MAKMTKAQARRRLREAESKVLRVMMAGYIGAKTGVDLANKLSALHKRIK